MAGDGARQAVVVSDVAALPLDAENYSVNELHRGDRDWVEKNCYVDVWIEALHALGLEPRAMLAFTVRLDFEGDQWTFFKPPHGELSRLYGIDVFELNLWRGDLLAHAQHHVGEGKLVFTEADAYWMPDTQGTDYRRQHTKSTIVINAIDVENRRMGYFHNAGYHSLEGEDFAQLFRVDYPYDPTFLSLYAEFARIDRIRHMSDSELAAISMDLLRIHVERLPAVNPIRRFAVQFPLDIEWLRDKDLSLYHSYAFATLRQLGANFELAALFLDWLGSHGENHLSAARSAFAEISSSTKALVLKAARAINARKSGDFAPLLDSMSESWDTGMDCLKARYR